MAYDYTFSYAWELLDWKTQQNKRNHYNIQKTAIKEESVTEWLQKIVTPNIDKMVYCT